MTPKELEQTIRALLQRPMADAELREQLGKFAAVEVSFAGFTWLFGPELHRRNRISLSALHSLAIQHLEAMGKNLGGAVCLFLVPKIVEVLVAWAAQ